MLKKLWVGLLIVAIFPQVVFAQTDVNVLTDQITITFPDTIDFHFEAETNFDVDDIKLLYRVKSNSCQEGYARQKVDFETGNTLSAHWEWELKRSGTLPPGTALSWKWEISDEDGNTYETPLQEIIIQDQRHEWETLSAENITVQWYVGSNQFGQEMHQIATDSIDRLSNHMGLIAQSDIHITLYPSAADVRDVLFGSTEWVGGVAFPSYNATIIGIAPGESKWANDVIPHELTHLLVRTMMFNCYGIYAPTWLDEGLAEYGENAVTETYKQNVLDALDSGNLPNLRSLESGFSAYGNDARLAYQQSGVVIDYLIDTYGQEKITELLLTMKDGNDTDNALQAVYGFDTNGLDQEWRKSLGFEFKIPENTKTEDADSPTAIPTFSLSSPTFSATSTPEPSDEAAPSITLTPETDVENDQNISDKPAKNNRASFLRVILVISIILLSILAGAIILLLKRK